MYTRQFCKAQRVSNVKFIYTTRDQPTIGVFRTKPGKITISETNILCIVFTVVYHALFLNVINISCDRMKRVDVWLNRVYHPEMIIHYLGPWASFRYDLNTVNPSIHSPTRGTYPIWHRDNTRPPVILVGVAVTDIRFLGQVNYCLDHCLFLLVVKNARVDILLSRIILDTSFNQMIHDYSYFALSIRIYIIHNMVSFPVTQHIHHVTNCNRIIWRVHMMVCPRYLWRQHGSVTVKTPL